MLTFTCTKDGNDSNSYALTGTLIDHEGKTVEVGEFTFNPVRAAKNMHYYMTAFDNVQVEFKTITL